MREEGGAENWRKQCCVTSKRKDLKAIKQFETLGFFFFVTAVFFFLTDVKGNIYRVRNILPV